MSFSVTAFVCVYNEEDILHWTIKHLIEQGIGVHIIDNWSTDGSDKIACNFPLVDWERFPIEGPSPYYSWTPLLRRVEELAMRSSADWIVHHDADEIRRSPRVGESLLAAFERVDKTHNAVNFQCYHFLPTDDDYAGDPERHFRYYKTDHPDSKMRQVKAWKNTGQRVDIASTGGHFANFPGVNVWPTEKFILKHYPIRSSSHGERKVIRERLGRYDPVEIAKKWHVQYGGMTSGRNWLSDPKTLKEWK